MTEAALADPVTEGPGLDLNRPRHEYNIAQSPFGFRLAHALRQRGVSVAFEDIQLKLGEQAGFHQLHIEIDDPDQLADGIIERLGKFVVFSRLWMPPEGKGVIFAGSQQADNVWVRQILVYDIAIDAVISRWDVMVKAAS